MRNIVLFLSPIIKKIYTQVYMMTKMGAALTLFLH